MLAPDSFKLRYILALEFSLLILFAIYGSTPLVISLSLILLCIVLYFTFNRPVIGIYIIAFSILADSLVSMKTKAGSPSILIAEMVLGLFLCFGVIKFLSSSDKGKTIPLLVFFWIPFLIWALLGFFVAVDKLRIISYWKNYFAGFFVFIYTFYAIRNKDELRALILGIIIWGVILTFLELNILNQLGGFTSGIIGLFFKKNLLTLGWGRSNYLAAFFVIIIPISIGYFLYSKSKKLRIFITVAILLMFFGIILTLSRGGILALLLALIILFSRVLQRRTFLPFLAFFLVVAIVLLLNPLTYVLINSISSLETSGSVYSRINFYEDVWHAFLKYPITGVGLGNLSYYATFILAPDASPAAHNIVLGALGETGIIGTIFYLLLLFSLLWRIFLLYSSEKEESLKIFKWCCFSSILGGLLHTLVEPTLDGLQFSIMFWTCAAVTLKLDLLKVSDQ